ncbi:hypothetical protein V6N13_110974 [Hibiscus sabdariffa]
MIVYCMEKDCAIVEQFSLRLVIYIAQIIQSFYFTKHEVHLLYSQIMAKNIQSLFENLQFTNMERVQIADGESHGHSLVGEVKFGMIGKLLSPQFATETVFVHTFTNIWAEEKAEILPLKHGIFLFKFLGEQQRLSILRRSSWLFDGELIITVSFDPSFSLNEYEFTKILYWVRIQELSMNMMTMDMASTIGSRFGKLVAVDTRYSLENLGEFFRLHVKINVSDPLLRCVIIGKNANENDQICPVQFEKHNKFCFNYGRLEHEIEICPHQRI